MIQTKITEPTRTPFNPHGFADATPLHAFYLGLLEKGLINKVLEEGNLEFENQNLFMTIDWESIDVQMDAYTFDVKLDIVCGVILDEQKVTNSIQVFINEHTLFIASAKTFNPKSGLTQSLNFDIPLRVLIQMGYYALPLKED